MTTTSALEQPHDIALNHYAKGLLKPFKGKGEVIRFRDELADECQRLWQESADFANRYNKTVVVHVGLWLKPHQTSGGRVRPIQWRDKAQKKMGRRLLDAVLEHGGLSQSMRRKLVEIEVERQIVNAKMSSVTRQIARLNRLIKEIEEVEGRL